MKRMLKKIKYASLVFRWFVWYSLLHGEFGRVWHLFMSLSKHVFLKSPYAVIIETSNTCNFHCPTCPTPHKKIYERRKPQFMDFELYKRIIDNIKDYVHIVYIYNSNEPLLHPRIVEMAEYAAKNNLHTMLSTNCSLLDEPMAERLLSSGLGEIRFALDSLKKEPFEKFRRGGDFETVKKNIEYFCKRKKELKRKRPITTIQFILNKLNQDEVQDIKKFVRDHEIDKLYIKPFILSEYAYSEERIKELAEEFYPNKDIIDEAVVYKKDEHGLSPKIEFKKCPDVKRVFTVLADGRAVMCCFDLLGDYVYGLMGDVKLKDLWWDPKVRQLRRAAHGRSLPLCDKCGNIE